MNRVCDLAPTRAISLVPGWTVLPSLPSFQGAPCSGNMLLPATTWDLQKLIQLLGKHGSVGGW